MLQVRPFPPYIKNLLWLKPKKGHRGYKYTHPETLTKPRTVEARWSGEEVTKVVIFDGVESGLVQR